MSENKPVSNVQADEAKITAQVVIRDKDGNIKYQGPVEMRPVQQEKSDGSDTQHGG